MNSLLELTIVYEDAGDGWITASIAEVPGANSQGRSRAEPRENVIAPCTESSSFASASTRSPSPLPTASRFTCSWREAPRFGAPPARQRRKLLREGANHSFWGIDAGRSTALPRHREIGLGLTRKICKEIPATRRLALSWLP